MANSRKKFEGNKVNVSGRRIKEYREKANLSRETLSAKLLLEGVDIPANSIANLENNLRTVVDYELCAIAKVLNVDVSVLLQDFQK